MKKLSLTAAAAGVAMMLAAGGPSSAAEIRVISSNALKSVLEELAPVFEKSSEHKLVFHWGAAVPLKAEIEKGATFDLAVLTVAVVDDLIRQGKLVGASRVEIAKSGIGVAVRKGAPKPDISTTEALKRALLNAKSVGYVEQGTTGIYLGPAAAARDCRTAQAEAQAHPTAAAAAVERGEVEIGMTQISEILPHPGAELSRPFPADIQLITAFATALGTSAKQPDPARALVRFLATPAAVQVIKAKGLDPAS